jgi:hypothetical protein
VSCQEKFATVFRKIQKVKDQTHERLSPRPLSVSSLGNEEKVGEVVVRISLFRSAALNASDEYEPAARPFEARVFATLPTPRLLGHRPHREHKTRAMKSRETVSPITSS